MGAALPQRPGRRGLEAPAVAAPLTQNDSELRGNSGHSAPVPVLRGGLAILQARRQRTYSQRTCMTDGSRGGGAGRPNRRWRNCGKTRRRPRSCMGRAGTAAGNAVTASCAACLSPSGRLPARSPPASPSRLPPASRTARPGGRTWRRRGLSRSAGQVGKCRRLAALSTQGAVPTAPCPAE